MENRDSVKTDERLDARQIFFDSGFDMWDWKLL